MAPKRKAEDEPMPLESSKKRKADKDEAAKRKEAVAHNMALAAKRCGELGCGPEKFLNSEEGKKYAGVALTTLKDFIKKGAPAGQKKALTDEEEKRLVKYMNWRNRYNVPAARRDLEADVIRILEGRRDLISARFPGVEPLSPAAEAILGKGKPGQDWFDSFYRRHSDRVTEKYASKLEVARSRASTKQSSIEHLANVEECLKKYGIMDESGAFIKSEMSRLIQIDEMPQPIDGSRGGIKAKVAGVPGQPSSQSVQVNREIVSVDAAVAFPSTPLAPHLIFKCNSAGHSDKMLPTNGHNNWLLTSSTGGVQTQESFRARLENIHEQAYDPEGVLKIDSAKGLVILTDGHASRFSVPIFEYLESKGSDLLLEPANTSTLHQMLDKVFNHLHTLYTEALKHEQKMNPQASLDHAMFMRAFESAYEQWAKCTNFEKAFSLVGITKAGTDITKIPPELWTGGDSSEPPSPPWNALQAPPFQFSPATLTTLSDSRGRDSFAGASAAAGKKAFIAGWNACIAAIGKVAPSLALMPSGGGAGAHTPAPRAKKVTQVYGSMTKAGILATLKAKAEEEEAKKAAAAQKKTEAAEKKKKAAEDKLARQQKREAAAAAKAQAAEGAAWPLQAEAQGGDGSSRGGGRGGRGGGGRGGGRGSGRGRGGAAP